MPQECATSGTGLAPMRFAQAWHQCIFWPIALFVLCVRFWGLTHLVLVMAAVVQQTSGSLRPGNNILWLMASLASDRQGSGAVAAFTEEELAQQNDDLQQASKF
eukprot:CAMPEP_0172700046 /NCGR_PEP_ID=MMETSP1074-20121228/30626_1 /TAXON_ID=2916 /ORGANISM="Ceratium fusus, Strain PA161109" /LENGTH=103 /DNA_ID=CAMNT_0013521355 /DNA_START=86 /DNA_END=394 /DNA_ORIENTATION=+